MGNEVHISNLVALALPIGSRLGPIGGSGHSRRFRSVLRSRANSCFRLANRGRRCTRYKRPYHLEQFVERPLRISTIETNVLNISLKSTRVSQPVFNQQDQIKTSSNGESNFLNYPI